MELTDLHENINTLLYSYQKHFLSLEDIDDNDNTFISVMRLNTNYRYLLREFAKRHIYEQYQIKRAVSQN